MPMEPWQPLSLPRCAPTPLRESRALSLQDPVGPLPQDPEAGRSDMG